MASDQVCPKGQRCSRAFTCLLMLEPLRAKKSAAVLVNEGCSSLPASARQALGLKCWCSDVRVPVRLHLAISGLHGCFDPLLCNRKKTGQARFFLK